MNNIRVEKDPRRPKVQLMFVDGPVEGVYFNELKNVKTYSGPNGPWTPTHSVNIVVNGVRIGMGLTDKETIRAKDEDDNYHDIVKGVEVTIQVEEGDEWEGKKQWNSKASMILVTDASKAKGPDTGGHTAQSKPRDFTGVEVGHAINAALNFMEDVDFSKPDEIVEAAKLFHTLTVKMKQAHAKANPKMSDYDVGASVGHAILNASKLSADMESVETFAQAILDGVVNPMFDFVRAGNKPAEAEKPKPKPAAKRAAKTAKAAAPEPEPEIDPNMSDNLSDMDDDIPF